MGFQERRKYTRYTVSLTGKWSESADKHDVTITTLGLGGCFMDSPHRMPKGDDLTIEIMTPGGIWLTIPAKKAYVYVAVGFGVRFKYLTNENYDQVCRLLPSHSGRNRVIK